jgi:hypothetical protein
MSTVRAAIHASIAASIVLTGASAAGQVVFSDPISFFAAIGGPSTTYTAPPTPCEPGTVAPSCPRIDQRQFAIGPLALVSGALWDKPTGFGFEPDALSDPPGSPLPGPPYANFATFESPTPLNALGLFYGAPVAIGPPPIFGPATFSFRLDNGPSFTRTTPITTPGGLPAGTMSSEFFGVISPTPFTRFTIEVNPVFGLPSSNNAAYNRVTIAAIPEPGTLALLGGGLLALGVAALRRGRAARRDDGA